MTDIGEATKGQTAAIMDGHATIAEAAAADLRAAGIATATLDQVAAHYRQSSAAVRAEEW